MTYDSSVFSRGNYYKDSFYFKNTKGSSAPKLRLRRGGAPAPNRKIPGVPSARQKNRPGNRDGRSFKAGWRIASAGVINRHCF